MGSDQTRRTRSAQQDTVACDDAGRRQAFHDAAGASGKLRTGHPAAPRVPHHLALRISEPTAEPDSRQRAACGQIGTVASQTLREVPAPVPQAVRRLLAWHRRSH